MLDASDLDGFRATQRLAFSCAEQVAAALVPGMTEREAATMLETALADKGVAEYFHRPFAWFGTRTTFRDFASPLDFFPTNRRLENESVGILDVAPVYQGHGADIGYSFEMGGASRLRAANALLRDLRGHILREVLAEKTMTAIYRSVDRALADASFDNCHQVYPFRVLAHRIDHDQTSPALRDKTLFRFGMAGARLMARTARSVIRGGLRHLWNDASACDVRPSPGLWAIEPHIGRDGVGAKWEELLVVTESTAYWLDDDVPHARASAI